jgi:hypothetical protein
VGFRQTEVVHRSRERHGGCRRFRHTDLACRSQKGQGVWRNGGVAGRRSAGLGSEGAARQVSHAVGVRARFRYTDAVRRGRKGQGVWRNGVCKTLVHTRLLTTTQRYNFSAHGEGGCLSSASSIRPCQRHEIPTTPHQATAGNAVWGCGAVREAACRRHATITTWTRMRWCIRECVGVSASSQTRWYKLEVPLDAAFTGEDEVPLAHCVRGGMTHRERGQRGKRWAAETSAPPGDKAW